MSTTNGKVEIVFLHPRDGNKFPAELGPATTGAKAIDELVKAGFIERPTTRPLTLTNQRTGKTIPLSASVAGSEVESGDLIQINDIQIGH
jgi:hypothetical protein